tara:strand:- start:140 stop:382 length:243 start_codon:yes stop_codon:yes gene_type:complete
MFDTLLNDLNNKKKGDTYHDSVIDDAIFHIKKAMECIDEGLEDPEKWHNDNMIIAKTFTQLFPTIYLLQQTHMCSQTKES